MSSVPARLAGVAAVFFALAGVAWAGDPGPGVARATSFGGSCQGCSLSGRKLTGATFSGGDFSRATLVGTDLRGASFTGASFVGADFSRADLRSSSLLTVNFSGAEMSRARGLSQRQLDQACGDEATTLPQGLHIPRCR